MSSPRLPRLPSPSVHFQEQQWFDSEFVEREFSRLVVHVHIDTGRGELDTDEERRNVNVVFVIASEDRRCRSLDNYESEDSVDDDESEDAVDCKTPTARRSNKRQVAIGTKDSNYKGDVDG